MNYATLGRAVEHLVENLRLTAPNQIVWGLLAQGCSTHTLGVYITETGAFYDGWGSDLPPGEMIAHEEVRGGNYTAFDSEPPAMSLQDTERWDTIFDSIHLAVDAGMFVRLGQSPDEQFIAVVEQEVGVVGEDSAITGGDLPTTLEAALFAYQLGLSSG